jgi:hypothetical protein
MGEKQKKSINYHIRSLHRDIGFFVLGLIVVYGLSGIMLIYKDTDFLKNEVLVEKNLSANIELSEVAKALKLKKIKVLKTEGAVLHFKNGTYNKETGLAIYSSKKLPAWLNKFIKLHKSTSRNIVHWGATILGILLLFLAISSFWMFKPKTKMFRRGIIFACSGIIVTIILLMI